MGILNWLLGSASQTAQPIPAPNVTKESGSVLRNGENKNNVEQPIELTSEFKNALDVMEGRESPVLITGNAGTGKSTLLRHFRKITRKNVIVVAPTGMAALNVRGVTIHSFFKLPPKLLQDKDIRINHQKTDMFKKIDTIVIDEVSMVRADILDAIDVSLRIHRASKEPFGGVQIIMFGDVCQLPPVVKGQELEQYFSIHYKTPYFFSAHAIERTGVTVLELHKMFRQADPEFIAILDRIRRAEASIDDMIVINERCVDDRKHNSHITLTTTNKSAHQINQDELDKLPPPECHAEAKISGNIDEDGFPAECNLTLKKSAQIMMLKNNGSMWVNGSIGEVIGWDENSIKVSLGTGNHSVSREKWEVIDYRYNKVEKKIEEFVVGTYEQFPIKLAWAITIHKSQGQTFDNVAIDMNKGAFAHGQLYVALSRCKSLQGISMLAPVALTDLCFDERVRAFVDRTKTGGRIRLGSNDFPVDVVNNIIKKTFSESCDCRSIISNAIDNEKSIEITYADYHENETMRVVTPISWIDNDKFTAHCSLRAEERTFRVSRITSCRFV